MQSLLMPRAHWTTSVAMTLLIVGCGGGGGKKLTPEQEVSAGALCNRFLTCGFASSSEMRECKEVIAGAFQLFPDPDGFVSCVNGLSCSQLYPPDEDALEACMDWDTSTIKCAGETTIGACSNSGKCTTISCPDVCNLMGGSFAYCGYNSAKGWDNCFCRM